MAGVEGGGACPPFKFSTADFPKWFIAWESCLSYPFTNNHGRLEWFERLSYGRIFILFPTILWCSLVCFRRLLFTTELLISNELHYVCFSAQSVKREKRWIKETVFFSGCSIYLIESASWVFLSRSAWYLFVSFSTPLQFHISFFSTSSAASQITMLWKKR